MQNMIQKVILHVSYDEQKSNKHPLQISYRELITAANIFVDLEHLLNTFGPVHRALAKAI